MSSPLEDVPVTRKNPARQIIYRDEALAVVARPTTIDDAHAIDEAVQASRNELKNYMPWAHYENTALTQLERLKSVQNDYWTGASFGMGLFDEASGEFLVGFGLEPCERLNPNSLEIGYWTATKHAGRGLATLATKIAIVYAFEWLGTDRVQIMHDEGNTASQRVIEKCGFVFEGTMRNALVTTAELRTAGFLGTSRHRLYALVPDDRAQLEWYAKLLARLEVFNIAGRSIAAREARRD